MYKTKRWRRRILLIIFQNRLLRGVSVLLVVVLLLFAYASSIAHDDGKQLIGICASGAQIAGSFVCPYLVVSLKFTKIF